eukprot:CCRYP_005579-RB/>CCRYP_005579-RB protein AED:0.45 eAED:0.45 QI:0/0.8/0.83/1/0/0.16/6/204/99
MSGTLNLFVCSGCLDATKVSKEVTLPMEMAEEEKAFTVKSLRTRTLSSSTRDPSFSPWQMLVQTPMDPSSSSPPSKLPGLMEGILCLEKSWRRRFGEAY